MNHLRQGLHHFSKVEGACDSVLVVCGLGTRSVRDATLSAWLKKMEAEVRRLGAVCVRAEWPTHLICPKNNKRIDPRCTPSR